MITASASKVSVLSEYPNHDITAKAGSTDNGSAAAAISVARQSRKKKKTTITASRPPSYSMCMEPSYCSSV